MEKDWKKYAIAFVITAAIFGTALTLSARINDKRVDELRKIQDSISINLLSSDMQFNLLRDANCDDLFNSSIGKEMNDLGDRLSYMESIGKGDDPELATLKGYYSLLQIRDYMLINSAAAKCPKRPTPILYFYDDDCDDCSKQGQVLTYLREHNPDILRVYSFDYGSEVSALRTLANIHKVKPPFPALVIKGKTYNGFNSIEDISQILPELVATTTNATSTSADSTKR